MKRLLATALLTVGLGACGGGPFAPTEVMTAIRIFTCFTQPRVYLVWNGFEYVSQVEVDTYTQEEPCPATRIP